jgi:replicative DNA helicase
MTAVVTPLPSTDPERALLGALLSGAPAKGLLAIARPGHFGSAQHLAIVEAILAVDAAGGEPEPLTVTAELRRRGTLQRAGGPIYLHELVADCATTANAEWWARQVHQRGASRALATELTSITRDATRPEADVEELRARVEDARHLLDAPNALPVPSLDQLLAPAAEMFRRRACGEETPLRTPWPGVTRALGGGLWPGSYVLTGATGVGKTAWALQLVWAAAREKRPVLYVALELDAAQIVARLASLAMGELLGRPVLHWSALWRGRVAPDSIPGTLERLQGLPIRVEEAPAQGWCARFLEQRIRALVATYPGSPAPLVVLDYLQLIGPSQHARREELRERIGNSATTSRDAARATGAVILLLSSVSRAGASELTRASTEGTLGTGDPADFVGLGKESGDIEFSADGVLALATEPKDAEAQDQAVWLALAKQRGGPRAWCLLRFNRSWFSEAADPAAHVRQRVERKVAESEDKAKERQAVAHERRIQAIVEWLRANGPTSTTGLRDAITGRPAAVGAAIHAAENAGLIVRDGGSAGGGSGARWALAAVPFLPASKPEPVPEKPVPESANMFPEGAGNMFPSPSKNYVFCEGGKEQVPSGGNGTGSQGTGSGHGPAAEQPEDDDRHDPGDPWARPKD